MCTFLHYWTQNRLFCTTKYLWEKPKALQKLIFNLKISWLVQNHQILQPYWNIASLKGQTIKSNQVEKVARKASRCNWLSWCYPWMLATLEITLLATFSVNRVNDEALSANENLKELFKIPCGSNLFQKCFFFVFFFILMQKIEIFLYFESKWKHTQIWATGNLE